MSHKIPKAVYDRAARIGSDPVFLGTDNGADVYQTAGQVERGEDGTTPPTGLPSLIVYKNGKVTEVDGLDALDLLSRLAES